MKDFFTFIEHFNDELALILKSIKIRTIIMIYNAAIHKANNVKELLKKLKLVIFRIP